MYISIRTTIFWNIFLLMALAVGLISIVVFRITEREMFKQRTLAGELIFSSIETNLSHMLTQNPDIIKDPSPESELQSLLSSYVERDICRQIFFLDNRQTVIAHSDKNKTGQFLPDIDVMQAVKLKSVYKKVVKGSPVSGPQLIISGPVEMQGQKAGFLKAEFPLYKVNQSITKASKIIFAYILFDAVILIAFGTFLLSRYLLNPVKKLIKLTEHISEGNFDSTPLCFSNSNEFGKLSTALKAMSEKITEEKDKIQEQFHALERKNLQLREAQKEIIQSEKLASIGRLAAGIAHEIGNPAGIILGYIHMLKDSDTTEKERLDYLDRMESESERLNTIIKDLLDYAQPSSREIQKINLNEIIKSTYSLISYQKEFNNIKLVFHFDNALPDLYANEKQIKQLIVNLVLNARDAMPGGGTLTFSTSTDRTEEEDKIVCTVTDTGEGIAPENQGKVFDPFFTTKQQGKGTGLGLSNVHRIVELAGGKISFSSTRGKGTAFTIIFPVIRI